MNALAHSEPFARQLVAQAVKESWEAGAEPDAVAALVAHPELRGDKVVLLDLAFVEYCRRRRAGEALDPAVFCARFPHRTSLRRMLDCHHFLEAAGGVLAEEESPRRWPEPGEQVCDFFLVRELGRGTFARVFLAQEVTAGHRLVVVKLSYDATAEAQTLGPLEHAHIVPVLSAPTDLFTGLRLLAMPYRGSATLEDLIDEAFPTPGAAPPRSASVILDAARRCLPLDLPPECPSAPLSEAPCGSYVDGIVRLGAQIADALAFLHARGTCHRDLKPSNVLLGPDGQALLIDFNLSAQDASSARLGGTLPYMAPEHVRAYQTIEKGGKAHVPLDGQSDLFALGVVLYELLAGHHPFGPMPAALPPEKLGAFLQRQQQAGPRPLQSLSPHVDRPLAQLIESCLAVDPQRRPRGAAELAEALQQHLRFRARLRRFARRHRPAVSVGVVALALLPLLVWAALAVVPLSTGQPVRPAPRLTADKWCKMGLEAGAKDDRAEAERCFREAVALDPGYWQAHEGLGRSFLRRGHQAIGSGKDEDALRWLREADKQFDRAIQIAERPNVTGKAPWELYYARGRARMLVGGKQNHREAVLLLNEAGRLQQPPFSHGPTLACLACSLAHEPAHNEALKRGNDALAKKWQSANLLIILGYVHGQKGAFPEARKHLDQAVAQAPGHPAAYYNRAHLGYLHYLKERRHGVLLDALDGAMNDVETCLAKLPAQRPREMQEAFALAAILYACSLTEEARLQKLLVEGLGAGPASHPALGFLNVRPGQHHTAQERAERALRCVEGACLAGEKPVRFTRDPLLRAILHGKPTFEKPPGAPRLPATTAVGLSLLDPLTGPLE